MSSRASHRDEVGLPTKCQCGNIFMDDSVFCRKCGRRRMGGKQDDGIRASQRVGRYMIPMLSSSSSASSARAGLAHAVDKTATKWRSMLVQSLLPATEKAQDVSSDDDEDMVATRSFSLSRFPKVKRLAKGVQGSISRSFRRVSRGRFSLSGLPSLCSHTSLRLIDRNGEFHQSCGHWAINNVTIHHRHKSNDDHDSDWAAKQVKRIIGGDVFHAFLDAGILVQLSWLLISYMIVIVMFAFLYLSISDQCALQLNGDIIRAYMLSLETMVTIGFGVPDPYMNGCGRGAIVLTIQSLVQLLMTSFLIGVIYLRLSRPQSRACTILFSKNACLREIDGVHYFMFRMVDLRVHHALLETHVRCYCAHKHPTRGVELVPMRLEHPDDDIGASVMLNLPFIAVHRIDAWSPLAPTVPPPRFGSQKKVGFYEDIANVRRREQLRLTSWPSTLQRQVDCETGNRQGCVCITCGASFGTARMLELHCKYNSKGDALNDLPEHCRHKELTSDELLAMTHEDPNRHDIQQHLEKGYREVVVLVEGIEPTTSATVQARHSYLIGGEGPDLQWDKYFVDCVTLPKNVSKGLVMDVSDFHSMQSDFHSLRAEKKTKFPTRTFEDPELTFYAVPSDQFI